MKKRRLLFILPALFALGACEMPDFMKDMKLPGFVEDLFDKEEAEDQTGDQEDDQDDEDDEDDEVVHVTGISRQLAKYSIEVGETLQIQVTVNPANATNKAVTYKTLKDGEEVNDIVSISDTGLITGLKEGKVDIVITSVDTPSVKNTIQGFTVTKKAIGLPNTTKDGYTKLTSQDTLKNGEIVNVAGVIGDKLYGLAACGSGTYITPTELSVDGNNLVVEDDLNYTVVKNLDNSFSFMDKNGNFLMIDGSGNVLKGQQFIDAGTKFVVSVNEEGFASIVGTSATIEQKYLSLNPNSGNPRWSCYKQSTAAGYAKYVIYHNGVEAQTVAATGVQLLEDAYEVQKNSTIKVGAIVLPATATDKEITYSLRDVSPAGCAIISGNNITGVENGTATIVATSHDGNFEDTATLTVIDELTPQHAGTLADPYTAADAKIVSDKLGNGKTSDTEYYIKGVVTSLVEAFNPSFGNYTFWLDEIFEGYRLFNGSSKAKFNEGDIEVGDTVTIYSKIKNYNGTAENDNGYVYSVEKPRVSVTGVSLDKSTLTIEAGSAPQTLVATVAPENASNKEVTWTSSNETAATVANGVVTPLAEGETTITAKTAEGDFTATCVVTVTAKTKTMTSITVEGPTKVTYTEGETLDLTGLVVTAHYDDQSSEVISAGYTTSIVAGTALTKADTSFTVTYGTFTSDPISLTINDAPRQALPYTITPSAGAFEGWTGEGYSAFATNYVKLSAVGNYIKAEKLFDSRTSVRVILDTYLNGTDKEASEIKVHALNDTGETVVYKTFAPAQISASQGDAIPQAGVTGRQVLMLEGTGISGVKIELTVRTANVVLTKIQITEPPVMVNSVSLSKTEMSLEYPGSNGELTATVLPENAELKDVEWTVSEGSSVTVANGVVTPVAVGQSTVTATAKDGSGKSASCVVTVTASAKVLAGIAVTTNPNKTSYVSGETFDTTGMVVTATYEGGSTEVITDYTYSTDKLVAGATSITISYGGKSTTVAITVTAAKGSTADNPFTLAEFAAKYNTTTLGDKEWSEERVYVQGEVKSYAASNDQYTMKDADDNKCVVFKPSHAMLNGAPRPAVGDVIIAEGWVENYSGTIQLTGNASDPAHSVVPNLVSIVSRGTSTISLDDSSSDNATVTFAKTATNGSEYTFTIEVKEGYEISSVKFAGNVVEGKDGSYTVTVLGNSKILVETIEEGQLAPAVMEYKGAATTNMSDASDAGAANAELVGLDSDIFSIIASKNTGSTTVCGLNKNGYIALYCNKNTADGGSIEISVTSAYIIKTIVIDWKQNEAYAKVTNSSGQVVTAQDGVYTINGTSFKIQDVANQSSSQQVHINSITIVYEAVEA